ncbi:MAG: protein rep [Bacteroidetes bacterium]|nr:protein rep [Bacteroidota bacterium]
MQKQSYYTPGRGILDTLAQSATNLSSKSAPKPTITIPGQGTEWMDTDKKQKRAQKKMITQKLMLSLVDVAKKQGEPERAQGYWNAYHCQSRVIASDGKFYGQYCKNRFCIICSNIRKAELIGKYLPVISAWPDPHFVTLTARSVPACRLKDRMRRMQAGMQNLLKRNKARALRGTEIRLIGVRSLECNFNPKTRTYNPHFHLIVATKEMGEIFIREWLEQCTKDFAVSWAQKSVKVKDPERSLIEVVKYGTKIFTDPTISKRQNKPTNIKVTHKVYAAAFDRIVTAMQGRRLFERFGFVLPKQQKRKGGNPTQLQQYQRLVYDSTISDWMDAETSELISGYKPDPEILGLLENQMDRTTR